MTLTENQLRKTRTSYKEELEKRKKGKLSIELPEIHQELDSTRQLSNLGEYTETDLNTSTRAIL
jgi:hypothetical protein